MAIGPELGRQQGVVEVLGPDADDDGLADVVAQRGPVLEDLWVDRHRLAADRHRADAVVVDDLAVEQVHRRRADERRDEDVVGMVVERLGRVDLLEDPVLQHRDAVAHRHRLDLVVGDVDRGDAEVALDAGDLGAHLDAELGVEVGQRLVHQERGRLAHDGTAHGDALALATRELPWLAGQVLLELEDLRRLHDPTPDLVLGDLLQLQREADVVVDGHVRVQRVVLEDHRDVAVARRDVVDDPIADAQRAGRDLLEPGDHPQRGGLAAARRADEDEELAFVDLQVEPVDGLEAVGVDLVDALERDAGHVTPPSVGGGDATPSMA